MKQPEALRLAENLEKWNYATSYQGQAAAELRRLHEANQAMLEALRICKPYIEEHEKLFLQTKSFFACNVINAAIAKGEAK